MSIPKPEVNGTRRYGKWAGRPNGYPEDSERCAEQVMRGMMFGQCDRKRGHGPDGLLCKQHAKMAEGEKK